MDQADRPETLLNSDPAYACVYLSWCCLTILIMHGVRFRSAIWILAKIGSFRSAIWFRLAIPIPNPNLIPNPTHIPIPIPNPNSTPNPIPNRNPNITVSLTLSLLHVQRSIQLSYCSTKTTHLQAEHKYTTKANLCIRVQTSDLSFFRYKVI